MYGWQIIRELYTPFQWLLACGLATIAAVPWCILVLVVAVFNLEGNRDEVA